MDIKTKVQHAKKIIESIATHDDATSEEVTEAMVEVSKYIEKGADGAFQGRQKRIEAREKIAAAKLEHKKTTKRGQEELKASKDA